MAEGGFDYDFEEETNVDDFVEDDLVEETNEYDPIVEEQESPYNTEKLRGMTVKMLSIVTMKN